MDGGGLVLQLFIGVAAKRSVVKRTGVLIRTTAYFMFLPRHWHSNLYNINITSCLMIVQCRL